MEAVRVIFNLLLFLIFLQSSSKAIAYLYDVFKCECDYFLPAYIIDVRQCGHSASCYWALQFYLTKMGEANIKVDGLPSVTELQTKWTTIMNNYESPIKYPFGNEGECTEDLRTCEGLMRNLFEHECERLKESIKVGKPMLFNPTKNPLIYKLMLTGRQFWGRNWTGLNDKFIHPNQNSYIVKCPTGFYLNSYHFTLNQLLSTIKVDYFATSMIPDLLNALPPEQKKMYTCNATSWVRYNLFRNISQYYTQFCQQHLTKDETHNGYICATENDPKIKATFKKGLGELCDKKKFKTFRRRIVDVEALVDLDMDSQFEEDCDVRKDCEVSHDSQIILDE